MQGLVFYLILPFIYLISILPFPILYVVSDFLCFLVFNMVGYRKKVVKKNLKNAFPEKTYAEIQDINKKFYRFFCDWIVEMIKSITISREQALKRCKFNDSSLQLLNQLSTQNKKIIFVMGHYGNFELGGAEMAYRTNYQLYVLYKPLSNPYFNKLINKKRTRFGIKIIAMQEALRKMLSLKDSNEFSVTTFIADQTPSPKNAYWTTFLNQDTPIFWGTELIAKKLNYPIVYICVQQYKRGFYEMRAEMLCENPKDTAKGEISEMHTRRLEKDIVAQPEFWLWSHKRWKHKRPQ
ncbi:MAG: lipid A biosynthesis acyltransferase [Flavobacteriales bacterium BRH_c54]|nr:MAG: lipid A biosynthesis acyltransferase [Flavobacteriales bacterium BRH_c54]